MAGRADRLDAQLVLGSVAEVMVVFVTSLAGRIDVAAVDARHSVWIGQQADVDVVIHASPRLLAITVARRRQERAKP